MDEPTAHQVMDRSQALGVNFFDTAELYSIPPQPQTYGLTEEIIGRWMKERGNRQNLIIATKAAGPWHMPSEGWIRGGKTHFDRQNIRSAVEDSLRRLQTDYLDFYQLHWPDRNVNKFGQRAYQHDPNEYFTPIQETLEVLQELQKSGKVRFFGLSNETPWGAMEFLRIARQHDLPLMSTTQNNYSLLTRSYENSMSEISHRENLGLLAYSPLGYGVLGGRYLDGKKPAGGRFTVYPLEKFPHFVPRYQSPDLWPIIKQYQKLAQDHGLTLPQLALAFVYQQPFVTSNIIGPSNEEQLFEDVSALEIKLSTEILASIEAIHEQCPNPCA